MLSTPILFLIFNRPDTTERVFEEIKKQKPKYLYIAADGPRIDKKGETEKCDETRKIINLIDWDCEVKTLFREENLGCKAAVSSAISWFFDNVEEGIILEDDCLPSQSFFNFCEVLLEKYRHDSRVMHISGENPLDIGFGTGSYYFAKTAHIWGWASWRRAWNLYDADMKSYESFKQENKIADVFSEKHEQEYWLKIFNRVTKGQINTWDYQWMYTLYINNGLSIIPCQNLVSNIGFTRDATHTAESDNVLANRKVYETDILNHPLFVLPNDKALDLILKQRFSIYKKTPLFVLKREINRVYKKLGKKLS